jgi:hypothetical protein
MTRSQSFLLRQIILLVMVMLFTGLAHAETKSVTLFEGHAVRDAVDRLEAIYDLPVTYEDPPMSYEHEVLKTARPLSFSYEVPPPNATPEQRKALAAAALSNVLQSYSALWSGDMFKVVEGNGGFEIIPVQYLDKTGNMELAKPILDTPISLPQEERTPAETIRAICKAVSAASGGDLTAGSLAAIPNYTNWGGGGDQRTLTFGASNEPARDVLTRLFAKLPAAGAQPGGGPCRKGDQTCYWDVPANLTWQVWCVGGFCTLNTQIITPPGALHGYNWVYKQQHKDEFAQ